MIGHAFSKKFSGLSEYLKDEGGDAAHKYRNRENGGLLYFRPVALPQLVSAILETALRKGLSVADCMGVYSKLDLCISNAPWLGILWDPAKHTMITSNSSLVCKLLLFMGDNTMLTVKERDSLSKGYAKALNIEMEAAYKCLNTLIGK